MSNNKGPKIHVKIMAVVLSYAMIFQLFFPTIVMASTGGSGQAENSSFIPSGASNMVNLFTGDLNYSIPLLDIEGYPISLSYNGNVGMNTDASWVGLGWSCSPGFINREMRGLPDDFNKDVITENLHIKPQGEFRGGGGYYSRWSWSIPFTGVNGSTSEEEEYGVFNSLYDGISTEKIVGEVQTSGDYFSNSGSAEFLTANSLRGYSIRESKFYTDKDFPLYPSMMSSETTSKTTFYNSRAGLTHIQNSAGVSSEFSTGALGVIADIVLTIVSFGGFGALKTSADVLTKLGKVSSIANIAMMVQPSMSISSNGGSVITTGTPTYTPSTSLESFQVSDKSESRSGAGFFFYTSGGINNEKTSFSTNIFPVKYTETNGFLNSSSFLYNSQVNTRNLYDMNRENDGVYYETMPNLPVTNATNDMYHVRGEGMIADYRAFRNDVGSYHSPSTKTLGWNYGKTKLSESNVLSYTKSETIDLSKTKSGSDTWNNLVNFAPHFLQFTDGLSVPDYEPYYFKNLGEKVSYNTAFYNMYGGDQPAQVMYFAFPHFMGSPGDMYEYEFSPLFGIGTAPALEVKNQDGSYSGISLPLSRNTATLKDAREHRNGMFIEKKAGDPAASFFEETIKDYVPYNELTNPAGVISDNGSVLRSNHRSNHTSEIVVQDDLGGKYVYGLPVYNNQKKRVSFNVTGRTAYPAEEELVEYNLTSPDNSTSNQLGYNEYYRSSEVPEYASSYMLTAVVNDDYIDATGNGITEDDYGNYTKFNYSKTQSNYNWRTPYEQNKANFSTVHHAYTDDEKGSYVYGNKEIWNVHSIESKNYIAEFYLSEREDVLSVLNENGGKGSNKLKQLDKIKLYAKEDRVKNGEFAIPIKTVHFEYDYSLCPNIPSNSGITLPNGINDNKGKLTLKKVYFTYGNSEKGEKSTYEFNYADFDNDGTQDVNYSFLANNTDRWGNYKPNSASLLNSEYPFIAQDDRLTADKHAAAWRLSQIKTPEGAVLEVYYEADDYAYVQNKRAMQMFKIEGTDETLNNSFDPSSMTPNTQLYTSYYGNNNIIYFKLQDEILTGSNADAKEILNENYLKDIEHLYFKSLVELGLGSGIKEYVEGYAKIKNYGVVSTSAPYNYGWIELDKTFYNGVNYDSYANPIAKAGWQALRTTVPRTYRQFTSAAYDQLALNAMVNGYKIFSNILYKSRGLAATITLNKSWIRLVNPNQRKVGGGARVKEITVKDNWGNMGGDEDMEYGQTYDYTTEQNGEMVSTGVAAYEPYSGKEENPWRTPVFFMKHNKLFPDNYFYQETPFGESHFPAPIVGYSSVKVKNRERIGVTENATGYVVNKFYTAKDFPTIVDKTKKTAGKFSQIPSKSQMILGAPTINHSFASQGFVIIKNDMHGQKKGAETYNEGGSMISKSTIFFKSDLINGESYQLDNTATVINSDGTFSDKTIGKDIDIFNSYRESYDESAFKSNTDGRNYSLFSLFGLLGKIESSSSTKSSKRLYTTVLTKVINQYGLVDRVETEELGTKKTLKNLAYDGETGKLLLTSVENEYLDKVYNFTYPAHWYYDNLGQSYKNTGITLANLTSPLGSTTGVINLDATSVEYFSKGDKLLLTYGSGPTTVEAWVLEIDNTNGSENIICIDEAGTLIPFTADPISLKIIESGRNNMQNIPIGKLTTLTNPIDPSVGNELVFTDVIQSSATELSDDWSTTCMPLLCYEDPNNFPNLMAAGDAVNPFLEGIKGKWRAQLTYSYNQERQPNNTTIASDIRTDGPYTTFKPFWDFNTSGKLVPIYDLTYPNGSGTLENWKTNTEITRYGKDGNLLETKDILDRYATTLYGYNHSLKNIPIAIVSNAEQKQIGFDGFEDYNYFVGGSFPQVQIPGHFKFNLESNLILEDEAHTGKRSLAVSPGKPAARMNKVIREQCENEDLPLNDGLENYNLENCDCENQFSPSSGEYIVSAWVKQNFLAIPGSDIIDAKITIEQKNNNGANVANAIPFYPTGPVIEGWQRIEGKIDIVEATYCLSILLEHIGGSSSPVYFDDVRVHPFNSAMKTMIYDPNNLRLMAELDNQNYATFFEYDEEGTLVRIKKETENGIVTIKETRSSIIKKP
jgi:hypothetical protein